MKFLRFFTRRRKRSLLVKTKRLDTADDTCSTEGSSAANVSCRNYTTPWKTENFLRSPIQESDWWESADESSLVDDTDSVGRPEARPEQQQKRSKKFCNRGYETWIQGRQAWNTATSESPRKPYKIVIPESFKAQLVKCLSDRRHFELSQRIPLSEMINAYQDVWNKPNE